MKCAIPLDTLPDMIEATVYAAHAASGFRAFASACGGPPTELRSGAAATQGAIAISPILARYFPGLAGACMGRGYVRRHHRLGLDQQPDGLLLTEQRVEKLMMFLREKLNPADLTAVQEIIIGKADDDGDYGLDDRVPAGAALPGGGQQPMDPRMQRVMAGDAAARRRRADAYDGGFEMRYPKASKVRQL